VSLRVRELVSAKDLVGAARAAPHVGIAAGSVALPDVDLRTGQRSAVGAAYGRDLEREADRHSGHQPAGRWVRAQIAACQLFFDEERPFRLFRRGDARPQRTGAGPPRGRGGAGRVRHAGQQGATASGEKPECFAPRHHAQTRNAWRERVGLRVKTSFAIFMCTNQASCSRVTFAQSSMSITTRALRRNSVLAALPGLAGRETMRTSVTRSAGSPNERRSRRAP
jgi:hypothetical protein